MALGRTVAYHRVEFLSILVGWWDIELLGDMSLLVTLVVTAIWMEHPMISSKATIRCGLVL